MGKRKERRKAAMSSSRRYKLDLFAEPSGDSCEQKGAGDNLNNGQETGVPNSPTSGKENPLSLLSQYSEDSDEEGVDRSSDASREDSVPTNQIAESTAESVKVGSGLQEAAPATIEDPNGQIETVSKEAEATGTEHQASEDPIHQSSSDEPVMQTISDVGGDWKAVMHAETNQCYYWNTVTGETSWEVPAGLVLAVPNEVAVAVSENVTSNEAEREVLELVKLASLPVEQGSLSLEHQMSGPEDTSFLAKSYVTSTEEDKGVNGGTTFAEDFDPEKLVEYGENLLERLKRLDGSCTQINKMKEEIEIRISDCKELKPYGMSLFPFWLHTQSKLSCLEASAYNAEASQLKSTPDSINEEDEKETTATLCSTENSNQMTEGEGEEKEKEMVNEKEENEMEKGQEEEKEIAEVTERATTPPIEDVDMEIEEEPIVTAVTNPDSELASISLEEGEVPPPPSPLPHEWAPPPPPPPEDEPAPSPPEEPSVSYSVLEHMPLYQNYMAVPSYNYSATSGVYTQPHYYEAYYTAAQVAAPVSGAVAQAVSVTDGTVAPAVYNYAIPVGQMTAETSTKRESNVSVSHTSSYVGTANEISVSSAGQAVGSVYVAEDPSLAISSAATSSATASSIADYSAAATTGAASSSAIPSAAATSAAPQAVSKDQLKVVKTKKRSIAVALTLRSNKKVASLVNKWKAAKEELHGDNDDEPESAYEALERKRLKAIEDWRLHQIASREAQDNANFVPLGGDWRERVKKKRTRKEARRKSTPETSSNATTAATSAIESDKQQGQEQPDLDQLSVGLPPGWQAYWDESSKQVYFGNASTAQTSWIRPV